MEGLAARREEVDQRLRQTTADLQVFHQLIEKASNVSDPRLRELLRRNVNVGAIVANTVQMLHSREQRQRLAASVRDSAQFSQACQQFVNVLDQFFPSDRDQANEAFKLVLN